MSTRIPYYAGQLQFGPDGHLYASTGDAASPQSAQRLDRLTGKLLRIDPHGSAPGEYAVPADNPLTQMAGCADGCDEIWSYGLRNPWRFSFDRLTGDLVIGDVGFDSWEEIDFETGPDPGKGDNFGWDCREGAHPGPGDSLQRCIGLAGTFTEPVFEYPHVDDGQCSITGGYVVRDPTLDDLYGRYLYAGFCTGELRSLDLGPPTAGADRAEGVSVPLVTSFGEDSEGDASTSPRCRAPSTGSWSRLPRHPRCPRRSTEARPGPTSHSGSRSTPPAPRRWAGSRSIWDAARRPAT